MPEFRDLAELAVHAETLLEPISMLLPNAVLYANVATLNPAFGEHLAKDIYTERTAELERVALTELPAGTRVLGGGHFVTSVEGVLVSEQYPVYLSREPEFVDSLSAQRPLESIDPEALMLTRYGLYTWGHWLAELLPKAVLTEARYPGRFLYVLPIQVLEDTITAFPRRIRESLAAYGIDTSRILPIRPERDYQFESLWAVTSVWSDYVMHPEAANLMHDKIQVDGDDSLPRRLAIRRAPVWGRNIENIDAIELLLRARGFTMETVGDLPFARQVAHFRRADLLFGVLGSDFTNLLYSPAGVKVITVAPAIFGDRFFYALVLARQGKQIDLRGEVTHIAEQEPAHRSTFVIDPAEVSQAITLLMSS